MGGRKTLTERVNQDSTVAQYSKDKGLDSLSTEQLDELTKWTDMQKTRPSWKGTNSNPDQVNPGKVANKKSFDKAFAAARKAGKKTFMWKGKSYSTKVKK